MKTFWAFEEKKTPSVRREGSKAAISRKKKPGGPQSILFYSLRAGRSWPCWVACIFSTILPSKLMWKIQVCHWETYSCTRLQFVAGSPPSGVFHLLILLFPSPLKWSICCVPYLSFRWTYGHVSIYSKYGGGRSFLPDSLMVPKVRGQ